MFIRKWLAFFILLLLIYLIFIICKLGRNKYLKLTADKPNIRQAINKVLCKLYILFTIVGMIATVVGLFVVFMATWQTIFQII